MRGCTVKRITAVRGVRVDIWKIGVLRSRKEKSRGETKGHSRDYYSERRQRGRQEAAISPSLPWCCRRLWVCQSIRTTGGHALTRRLSCLQLTLTPMTLLCVCLQMANLVTSLCCVVLAAVVVAYAQRRSQLGEYAFYLLLLPLLLPGTVPLIRRGLLFFSLCYPVWSNPSVLFCLLREVNALLFLSTFPYSTLLFLCSSVIYHFCPLAFSLNYIWCYWCSTTFLSTSLNSAQLKLISPLLWSRGLLL